MDLASTRMENKTQDKTILVVAMDERSILDSLRELVLAEYTATEPLGWLGFSAGGYLLGYTVAG